MTQKRCITLLYYSICVCLERNLVRQDSICSTSSTLTVKTPHSPAQQIFIAVLGESFPWHTQRTQSVISTLITHLLVLGWLYINNQSIGDQWCHHCSRSVKLCQMYVWHVYRGNVRKGACIWTCTERRVTRMGRDWLRNVPTRYTSVRQDLPTVTDLLGTKITSY